MKKLGSFALVLVVALTMTATVWAADPTGELAVIQAAADAYLSSDKAPVISAAALFENLNDGDTANDPFIVSVRSPEHYALGHIPGAINIPWKTIAEPDSLAKLPTDKQIVVYCYTGHTGQIANTVLNLLGYNAVNLKFGMMGWTKNDDVLATARFGPGTGAQDYALETEANEATEIYDYPAVSTGAGSDFEIIRQAADNYVKNAPSPIIPASAVFENINDGDASNDYFVVSVRAAEHYVLGHVPGAINIGWKAVAKPENMAKLPSDRPIAIYCYTGHTGMVAATALGMMGYETHNVKYGMMGWTMNDDVLATARYDVATAPDYALEMGEAPVAMPVSEPAATPVPEVISMPVSGGIPLQVVATYVVMAVGALSTGAGILIRRRRDE